MGGLCTRCRPQVPKDENTLVKHHGSFLRPKKTISAAFSYGATSNHETETMLEPLEPQLTTVRSTIDINAATEEDFMTVPNISRVVAHNIIDYRRQIGGFRRIEDLVLVNGIGAGKLEKIRKELHVSKSCNNLAQYSVVENITPPSYVNINTAAADIISTVSGLTDEISDKIVQYRVSNGEYHHINDLVEPAHIIDITTLLRVKSKLRINESGFHSRQASNVSSRLRNGSTSNFQGFGPECVPSTRARVATPPMMMDGRSIVRIATWNLQHCSSEKTRNPGVREVVCMTILENGVKIVGVQELADDKALNEIVNELNNPTLPNIQRFKSTSTWKCCVLPTAEGKLFQGTEYSGFLWDESVVNYNSSALVKKSVGGKEFARQPMLGFFKVGEVDLVLVNLHMEDDATDVLMRFGENVEDLPEILDAVDHHIDEEKRVVVIVDDFNMEPDETEFKAMRGKSYRPVIPCNVPTNISRKNMKGSRCRDNIWLNQSAAALYTSEWKVVRNGLTNPWIPDGWSWGGVVSDHCPVWVQLFVDHNLRDKSSILDTDGLTLKVDGLQNEN
ncbi:endonuclease/exonuclease/phosphatase family domain-containing protein 1 [Ciona intestinalis]